MVSPFWDAGTMMKWLANAVRCFRRLGQSCNTQANKNKNHVGIRVEQTGICTQECKSTGTPRRTRWPGLTSVSLTSLETRIAAAGTVVSASTSARLLSLDGGAMLRNANDSYRTESAGAGLVQRTWKRDRGEMGRLIVAVETVGRYQTQRWANTADGGGSSWSAITSIGKGHEMRSERRRGNAQRTAIGRITWSSATATETARPTRRTHDPVGQPRRISVRVGCTAPGDRPWTVISATGTALQIKLFNPPLPGRRLCKPGAHTRFPVLSVRVRPIVRICMCVYLSI